MKLLFITRKIDKSDGLAGFTYNWVRHFAGNLDKLEVICQERGDTAGLPDNVTVHSLHKENGAGKWNQFWTFQKYCRQIIPKMDGVFSHQNPEYGILAAPWAKVFGKKLIAWYAHGSISSRLRILEKLAHKIVTSSEEGFRLHSSKKVVLHQGIDIEQFSYQPKSEHAELRLLTVGRISPTKNLDLMIELVLGLVNQLDQPIKLKIVGAPALPSDHEYLSKLKREIDSRDLKDNIEFVGSVANNQTPSLHHWADVFLNFSQTGSLDKAVFEAMSCGSLVITSNRAFRRLLSDINPDSFLSDYTNLAENVIAIIEKSGDDIGKKMSDYVKNNHNLDQLTNEIIYLYGKS